MMDIAKLIKDGSVTFITKEYLYLSIFIALFALLMAFVCEVEGSGYIYTTTAFIVGALTSMSAGALGMYIAVYTNVRTTYGCC
mmetsp:Transcript_7165/g.5149  ORF Transcript_7165/g.5149 Transcript_7165/m.5149 type:complete len:83 (+) Transcript_7165:332-580(+)